jgi:hypothetical protein
MGLDQSSLLLAALTGHQNYRVYARLGLGNQLLWQFRASVEDLQVAMIRE